MTETERCTECGAELQSNAPRGICPKCLLRAGLVEVQAAANLRIRCPHCHNPIELLDDSSLRDVDCPSCGSHFSLADNEATVTLGEDSHYRVGHFQLIQKLGIGQFGTVWKAKDTELDRTVAIKVPRKDHLSELEREQFLREARAAAQLRHPNIVSVHEVGRENGTIYIASDYVQGADLKEWLTGQRLASRETAELCRKVAEALHHAHEQGVVHRDLKPGNIMLDLEGEPYIMDFGLAKRDAGEITMTMDGQILGTPAYMSPEQARGEGHQADRRADVYSLGVILYELLTGELPFRGDKRMLIVQILTDEPTPPRRIDSGVPRDLETICLKCLEKEPGKRYSTAQKLADDLGRYLRGEAITARPVTRIERVWRWCRRNPVVSTSITTVLLVMLIAGGVVIVQRRANQAAMAAANAESERNEIQTTVAVMSTAQGVAVPFAIKNLDNFTTEMVLVELRKQYETYGADDEARKLPLAYALAHFGDVRTEFLVSQVEDASPNEVDNFVAALGQSSTEAVAALEKAARTADSEQNWHHKARPAMLSLRLNVPALAQEMCRLRPDPIQRTWFIEECSTWHGDLTKLAQLIADSDDSAFRSGMTLVVGSVPVVDVSPAEQQAWEPVLAKWFTTGSDSITHSAADWTLRQWNLRLPKITTSKTPVDGMNWHVNSVGMTLLTIPAGSFVRKDSRSTNAIEQTVTLTRSFLLADREVTRAQFQQFIDDPDWPDSEKPTDWKGAYTEYSPTEQHPVQQVNWYDAVLYCNWLSRQEGLMPCYKRTGEKETINNQEYDAWQLIPEADGYRLPTEAEWEYACRAGTVTTFSHGDEESLLDRYLVYRRSQTELSGSKLPNGWGLYDMHGNVLEWCQDRFAGYGSEKALTDPMGSVQGDSRVLRGGSFLIAVLYARSAYRHNNFPDSRYASTGFRAARTYNLSGKQTLLPKVVTPKKPAAMTPAEKATVATVKKHMTPDQLALGDPVVNSIGMKLVPIPSGEFQMGSPDSDSDASDDEKPQHLVKITKPFYLSVYEVTQQQYEKVMGVRPWQDKENMQEGPDYPATYVSWEDAVKFCHKLSKQEGVEYRLPTEAQWEYACRAGTTTAYSFGDDVSKLEQYAWYDKNAWDIGEKYAHRVGQKLPNSWGLYDMHGNVWEWCQDWYASYDCEKVDSDPTGPAQGKYRLLRGGSFNDRPSDVRSALRYGDLPTLRINNIGFRPSRTYR